MIYFNKIILYLILIYSVVSIYFGLYMADLIYYKFFYSSTNKQYPCYYLYD
uniref:Uncharacterized protein n=1 Tax=Grateloupia filicina TaxID=31455 RepID=A0A2S1FXF5_9FLOR|nr:hypothetical protein Grafi_p227 [Grateloupia filicina]AWD77454.1 hypothetical protein Grafi_p227 [Grateloupia filicina]